MSKIFEYLLSVGKEKSKNLSPNSLLIRGLWRTDYVLKLTPDSTLFHLHYILVQTDGIGCSYYEAADEEPGISKGLIDQNAFEIEKQFKAIRIAALDSVYANINDKPSERIIIDGTNYEKEYKRAEIVCNEALSTLNRKKPKNGKNMVVLNVGVVGTIISRLIKEKSIQVTASDYNKDVVGPNKVIHGIQVEFGDNTVELIAKADLAIITGMTLATDSIDDILNT
ncbi:MAG: hypothetical protein KAS32_27630, partial [Candidatus Peribacteraceae bacterium]|nr:hypothetical protein [Candidatus Peribacteraceae bacterium]